MKYTNDFGVDIEELNTQGYSVIPGALNQFALNRFEETMSTLANALAERRQLKNLCAEPMIDLLTIGGEYREILFLRLKYLHVIQAISSEMGDQLERSGFYQAMSIRVPLVWPTLRADPPDEDTYLLPMHQDYESSRSQRSWRMWIPFRAVDELHGTMRIVPGSHKSGFIEHDLSDPKYPVIDPSHYQDLESVTLDLPAGDAVIFNPFTVHASVPNQSDRMKYVMLIQIQDHSVMLDPEDPEDRLARLLRATKARADARKLT